MTIIALKWGFPNFSDGINTTADVLAKTIDILEYIGIALLFVYLILFYHDTISFGKKVWFTIKKQGLHIIGFFITVFVIEVAVQYLFTTLGLIFAFFAFLVLIAVVNSLISSKYGTQSYTAMLLSLTKDLSLENEPLVPSLKDQIKILTDKPRKRLKKKLIIGTVLPVLIYYLIMYLTTAVTPDNGILSFIFFVFLVPLTITLISFSLSLFFVREPLIKPYYSYALKLAGIVGALFYYFHAINALVYNIVGYYPILVAFYAPFVVIVLRDKKTLSDLLLELPTENRKNAYQRFLIDKDITTQQLKEAFCDAPSFLKLWLAFVVTKRFPKEEAIELITPMITSAFPLERAIGALCLLYLDDKTKIEQLVRKLERDDDYRVRKAIAYGLRFVKELPKETYKRIIDAQYYEENGEVLETLKETIAILEERFEVGKEEEEEVLEEVEEEF